MFRVELRNCHHEILEVRNVYAKGKGTACTKAIGYFTRPVRSDDYIIAEPLSGR